MVTHKRSAAVAKKLARQKSKPKLLQGFIGPKSCLGLSEQVCMDETSSKNFNQLWQGIQELKETMLIQNKRLDKLTTIENKLDGIQQKMVEYENKFESA